MRQYHNSCDQCRKSKRACDIPRLSPPDHPPNGAGLLLNANLQAPKVRPCSYCKKTNKSCTVEWAWSQVRIAAALEAASLGELGRGSAPPSAHSRRTGSLAEAETCLRTPATEAGWPGDISGPMQFGAPAPAASSFFDVEVPLNVPGDAGDMLPVSIYPGALGAMPGAAGGHDLEFDQSTSETLNGLFLAASFDQLPSELSPTESGGAHATLFSVSGPADFTEPFAHPLQNSYTPSVSCSNISESDSLGYRPLKRRRHDSFSSSGYCLSPFSASSALNSRSNSGLIFTNLLQIYHDVLEHNLSCWLTEASCPYKGARDREEGRSLAEWGPAWSNRIFHRTIKLDCAAQASGLVQLTPAEGRAAGRALHYAIMAFATQWAQGSRRQSEGYDPHRASLDAGFDELAEESFDRDLQRHFWNQAQKALQEVEHVECYRVAAAEMVFSIAQRPWAQDDVDALIGEGEFPPNSERSFEPAFVMSKIARAISKDGPPVYMERAARKMQVLRSRFVSATRKAAREQQHPAGQIPQLMTREDETTVGLLYWLAVMFDTLSSSMGERPVTVIDQESQPDDLPPNEKDEDKWRVDLFIRDSLDAPSQAIRWPCPYDDAAEAVTRSGPVKVLLYRHVSYLQALLRRGQTGARVEETLAAALSLYRYWNVTYGAFFRALLRDFHAVPGRVRSWFFCIAAHWHLAVLMLADLVEQIDDEGLGLPCAGRGRVAGGTVAAMRKTSARELADLSRVAVPGSAGLGPLHLAGFHHAVNEGAVLTEPWTIVLIRAFSRAAVLIMDKADQYRRYGLAGSWEEADKACDGLERADDCVRALFYLGRKSDMARRVADVLSGPLALLRRG